MFKTAMKSTSVLALCTALTTPASFAQDTTEDLAECTVVGPFPCVTAEGVRVESALELAKESVLPSDPAEEEGAATTPEPPATPETAQTPDTPATPGEVTEAPQEAPAQDAATAEAEAEADAQAETDAQAAEAQADVEADAQAEAEAQAGDPGTEATDGDVEDTDAGSLAESLAEEIADEVAPEDPAQDNAEAPADEPAQAPAEDPAPDTAQDNAQDNAQAPAEDPAPETTDETTQAAPQESGQDTAPDTAQDTAQDAEPAADDTATADRAPKDMPSAEAQAEAETAATQSAAAQDATSDDELLDDSAADAEGVETVQVTEETARSSDEAFATDVAAGAQAEGEAQAGTNPFKRELTSFEKTLLAGLGGVAIGTILANGDEIIANSGDRLVLRSSDGSLEVLKDDDEILRQPGSEVRTRTYDDGSTRTVVTRPDGVRIVTTRAANGTVLKRVRVLANGDRYVLFDDTRAAEPVDQAQLQARQPARDTNVSTADEQALREALLAAMNDDPGRRYSLRQVREFESVRDLAPVIEVDAVTFATGSSVIEASQAEELAALGTAIRDVIEQVPDAVFLIEGHTDAVGDAGYNLALSDRRAESVALALTEYFDVPPENLITQGYGEAELKIMTSEAERRNRRANVRNITPLLR